MMGWYEARGHFDVESYTLSFEETARELPNPGQGFYYMYGFRITDEEVDYQALIESRFAEECHNKLAMIQINLQEYREGEISPKGLENLDALFDALQSLDKQLIVRFLYDWNGENEIYEPEKIEIILRHMEQSEEVLRKYKDKIYVMQGLFIGNWGEMNGTRYTSMEDLQKLSQELIQVTDESTYLSVRMPMHWRRCTGQYDPFPAKGSMASRLGLYNDGMLGSESDYGTYGNSDTTKEKRFSYWSREDELEFQNILCRYVPNGGEVIVNNEYNDFDNAVKDLARMHVSYLNRDYDQNVLNKWAETTVTEGVFTGLDGLTYIERHLGYRILIRDVQTSYDFWGDTLSLTVNLKNVGFAPVYTDYDLLLTIYNESGDVVYSEKLDQDIRRLYGGEDAGKLLAVRQEISLEGWETGTYTVYLKIQNAENGQQMELANEERMTDKGYKIATFKGGDWNGIKEKLFVHYNYDAGTLVHVSGDSSL